MTKHEQAFLAQVALGWFSMHPDGSIWRNVEFHGGEVPSMEWIQPRRAETSCSAEGEYPRVMFHSQGERLTVNAHRVVWIFFNKKTIPGAMEINHKDCDKTNHHPDNLELVTRAENVRHAIRTMGRRPKAQDGQENAQAKLSESQVMEIRTLWEAKALPQREIAARFGVEQSTVSAIVRRKSWKHVA